MPFKNVSQPKKVAELRGSVTGASYNKKLGSVAMIAHNPTEIAIVAQTGGPKIFGTQLDDVSDIALISRDMAVVRSGDTVWGVLDLAHKAKIEQIVSDVRLLVGPQGEAALGLKWDNSCEQLTPGKNEVAQRNCTLRGDHRAVDVGEVECYAVVEGGDGHGEFRVHPGSTPEQGSLAKVALPEGSKKLDRVRGGKFLSAVYKRGEATVCLIRRAGNRLEPKLIRLDAPVTDLAVADTSLLAISKDGRVILYDSDAISNASDSRIEPKSETHLGCQGEPRVIVVAHASIYVGTSLGEIISAMLVRKQLMQ
ncbi:MAG TPA: hypothetical protein VL400_09575 [Polyangiaceae bacterium]|jgi:hypothetical protein|nr:hypothetical protein [Polyangiaceae bacterium]